MRPYKATIYLFLFIIAVLLAGCANPPGELFEIQKSPPVWPEPPDWPRIKYVGQISMETDLKKEVSWFKGLGEFIFGKNKTGVLVCPYGVAFEKDKLFVSDVGTGTIHVFNFASREYKQFGAISKKGQLLRPVCLTIFDNKIYVTDSLLNQVCVFDLNGKFLFSFGHQIFKRPSGIAYSHQQNRIYIADTISHLIRVFDSKGNPLDTIGSRGIEPGKFNFPTQLWVDAKDQLYVSDTLNYRVQVFSGNGTFVKSFGQQGDRPGYFAHPAGISADRTGNIYVTDRQFENFQLFDRDGNILLSVGHEGTAIGQFWLPAGIFVDNNNRIYVADSYNKRIQIFELLEEAVK